MLRRRILDYLHGDVLAKIMSFVALLATGAWATKEDIGNFNLIIFAAEMMAVFITFGADSAIVKFYRDHSPVEVFSNYVFQSALNLGIAALALYAVGFFLSYRHPNQFILENYLLIVSLSIFLSISNITRAHLVSLQESYKVKWYSILSGALNLTSVLLLASILGLTIFSLVTSRIVSLLIYAIFFAYMIVTLVHTKNISIELIKKMYRFSVPLLISTIVGTLSVYMSRIVAAEYVSPHELGVFSFFVMLMASASVLLHSFNQAWYPHLFDLHRISGDEAVLSEINEKLRSAIKIAFYYMALSIFLYIISSRTSFVLNGYYNYRYIMFTLIDALVYGAFYIIINPLIYINSQTKYVAYASAIILALNILLTFILAEMFGMFGAAVSTVVIALITFAIYLIFARKILSVWPMNRSNLIALGILLALWIVKCIFIFDSIGIEST